MSATMIQVREYLSEDLGPSYARIRLNWLCKKYGITPMDEVPQDMFNEIKY